MYRKFLPASSPRKVSLDRVAGAKSTKNAAPVSENRSESSSAEMMYVYTAGFTRCANGDGLAVAAALRVAWCMSPDAAVEVPSGLLTLPCSRSLKTSSITIVSRSTFSLSYRSSAFSSI